MQRKKDVLLSWFYACRNKKRCETATDESASSDNANEYNMSEDDGYMSSEGGRDPEMTVPCPLMEADV